MAAHRTHNDGRASAIVSALALALAARADAQAPAAAAPAAPPRLVLRVPGAERVAVQTDLEFTGAGGRALRFDLYRPPPAPRPRRQAATAMPPAVVILVNAGNPSYKDNEYAVAWARAASASGLAAVTYQSQSPRDATEDFDSLAARLRRAAPRLGVNAERAVLLGGSAHGAVALPLAMARTRPYIKAAVIYYSAAPVAPRPDLPVLLVRAGLDEPALNRRTDSLVARALAANAPWEVVNVPGAHHPFELGDDHEPARAAIARTLAFMRSHTAPAMEAGVAATLNEATAAAALGTGDWPEAVRGYTALAAAHPDDAEMQRRLGEALLGAGDNAGAAAALERATALGHWRRRDIAYSAAVAYARGGDAEAALRWARELLARNYDRDRLRADPNFAPLLADPRFTALLDRR